MTGELTPEVVFALGRWNPRRARVMAVADYGGTAVALVESSGEQAGIDVAHYRRSPAGAWVAINSSGPVPVGVGVFDWSDPETGPMRVIRWAYGRTPCAGRHVVAVAAWRIDIEITPGSDGWWAWVGPVSPSWPPKTGGEPNEGRR